RTGVEYCVDARNGYLALGIDFDFDDRANVGDEAAVDGDAQTATLLSAHGTTACGPIGTLDERVEHVEMTTDVDGIVLDRGAHVGVLGGLLREIENARLTQHVTHE